MNIATEIGYTEALVDLTNALQEWKDAGGDPLEVTRAIQQFVFVLIDEHERRKTKVNNERSSDTRKDTGGQATA